MKSIEFNQQSQKSPQVFNSEKEVVNKKRESNIMIKEMTKIIDKLEEEFRIPFLMHYQGYQYQEIADKFEIPIGTIKNRIFFAKKILKKEIQKRYMSQVSYN